MREIVFDTETTGFAYAGGDRLVEIGCVELYERIPTGRTFHAYVNPERPMPAAAQEVHGLSDAFLADKPKFVAVVDELLEFLGDSPLVAHNAAFDFGFLNAELTASGRIEICRTRMVDTLDMAKRLFPGSKHSLDALCARFGVDTTARTHHGALLDAHLLTHVYIELCGGRQITLGLSEAAAPARAIVEAGRVTVRPARAFAPSAAELERHAAFMATFESSLWNEAAAS